MKKPTPKRRGRPPSGRTRARLGPVSVAVDSLPALESLGAGNATAGLRVLCDEVLGPGGRALLERLGDGDLAAGLRKILSENR